MRLAAIAVVLLSACAKEEPLVLEPGPQGERREVYEHPKIAPAVYDHISRSDLVSAANSRYGGVELNLAAKPDVAETAAKEAATYLGFAADKADKAGAAIEAQYE